MTARRVSIALVTVVALAGLAAAQPKHTPPKTDKEKIANAMSAAPKAVAQDATIMDIDEKGEHEGAPRGQGNLHVHARQPDDAGQRPDVPRQGRHGVGARVDDEGHAAAGVGFGYMLMGGSDASNDDPYATKPAAGKKWVDTGAHVMVLNPGPMADAYPKSADDPKKPYVMWPGTPYQHLMIPVK